MEEWRGWPAVFQTLPGAEALRGWLAESQGALWLLGGGLLLCGLLLSLLVGLRGRRRVAVLPRLDGTLLPDGSFSQLHSTDRAWLDFRPEQWQQPGFLPTLVHPDERTLLEHHLHALDVLPQAALPLRLQHPDGRECPVLLLARRPPATLAAPVELSLVALQGWPVAAAGERNLTEQASLLALLPLPLLLVDEAGRVQAGNAALETLLGLSFAQWHGHPLLELPLWQSPADAACCWQHLQAHPGEPVLLAQACAGRDCHVRAQPLADGWLLDWQLPPVVADESRQLASSEERFRLVFEAMPDALILSRRRDGRMQEVNAGFTRLTGMSREEVLGRTSTELGLWPDLADRLRLLQALRRDGHVEQLMLPFCGRHGQILRCEFNSRLLEIDGEQYLLSLVRDSTERELLQERLRQAAAVFESTAEAVIIMDLQQQVMAVNRAFSAITGYGESEVLGRRPCEVGALLHDAQCEQEVMGTVLRDGHWQGEVWSRRKNGESYPCWLTLSAVRDSSHQITHHVAVFADITSLKQAQARLDHQANHDPLTGLPNRALFENRLLRAIEDALIDDHQGAVLFLDIDRFKHINDSLGHPVGDELLRSIAQRLQRCLREVDVVARLGGDEFIVLMPALRSLQDVEQISARLMDSFVQPFHVGGHELFVTASMGISLFPQNGCEVATLVKSADAAMYRAKARGRNRVEYYSDELGAQATERVILANDLRRAILQGQMSLVFQPKLSLLSGQLTGAEVLLRWTHPEHGEISPDRFIPIAEDSGCILELGNWVLEESCRQLRQWQQLYRPFGTLAVNLAGAQIGQPDLPQHIASLLQRHELAAESLELEITETFIMGQAGEVLPILCALRELGVQLAIDDFGTGYSSLSYLKRLPVHTLKIDKSFIDGLPDDAEDAAIARAIIALGRSMHLTVVAEGVETKAQERFLSLEGCQQIQGYIVSRPLPAAAFAEQFLQRRQALGAVPPPSV